VYEVTDPIEHVLSSHQHMCGLSNMDSTPCMCGRTFDGGPGYHRQHVAAHIRWALGLPAGIPWREVHDA
jgi:hypothetical protein